MGLCFCVPQNFYFHNNIIIHSVYFKPEIQQYNGYSLFKHRIEPKTAGVSDTTHSNTVGMFHLSTIHRPRN